MTAYELGRDAAFAAGIGVWAPPRVVIGYLGGPDAYHTWSEADWIQYKDNPKIPTWVGGMDGTGEGWQALQALYHLGVPRGKVVMLDLETRIDKTYVTAFGAVLQWAGFLVWPYGSTSTIFQNPQLNGYAVADPTGTEHMYPHPGVRMTQYAFGPSYDSDAVKEWILGDADLWV
jgi:hypothetical protein